MTELDTRWIAYILWGVGTVVVYGVVLYRRQGLYVRFPDRRSRRDLMEAVVLFIVALASFLAITMVLWGEPGTGIRGMLVAVALGAYTGAGVIMLSDQPGKDADGH